MPRAEDIPSCPPKPNPNAPQVTCYEIEVITPMVAGGSSPGEVDPDFPIRPTAIRGHLRHWWRLIRGYSLGGGMQQREEEIFGSTVFPSPVTVSVVPITNVDRFDAKTFDRFGPEAYALFASIENNHQVTREGLRFRLSVQIADYLELNRCRTSQNKRRKKVGQSPLAPSIQPIAPEVNEALAAWLTFGGIGGRTRRGCGAMRSANVGSAPPLPARIFVGAAQQVAFAAWREALNAYREFRQTPRGPRHTKTLQSGKTVQVPGRSRWPEADSIRKITGCALKPPKVAPAGGGPSDEGIQDHSTPVVPNALLPAFPKAALGLPINFHFADGPKKQESARSNLDPKDVQLYPLRPAESDHLAKAERMASPVITRPLWKDGQWLPAIIILNQSLPEGLQVRVEGRKASLTGDLSYDVPLSRVIDSSLAAITPMRQKSSAIEALIEFLRCRNFTEVRR